VLYFLDTSALVKRYHVELGSPMVIGLFDDPVNYLAICSLSLAETLAVLVRRRRRAEISEEDFDTARFRVALDISTERVGVIDDREVNLALRGERLQIGDELRRLVQRVGWPLEQHREIQVAVGPQRSRCCGAELQQQQDAVPAGDVVELGGIHGAIIASHALELGGSPRTARPGGC